MSAVPPEAERHITEPGVYTIPDRVYHGDPVPDRSLSCSGAKRLLPPNCPALFDHERRNGRPPKRVFDFGHAAHSMVLGIGAPLAIIDAPDYRTQKAQDEKKAAYAAGEVPVLIGEHQQVIAMADAIRAHPIASRLFDPDSGAPEQSLFRRHANGTWLRSRLDWLPNLKPVGRMVLPDYKTAPSAEPSQIEKAMASFGYHQQAAWYSDMVTELGLAEQVAFILVFQEKTAPYLVTVVEPDQFSLRVGRHLNDEAIRRYAECTKANDWPSYVGDDIPIISLPPWVANQYPELA